uniref:Uncharacterized protein n=1 Tax=Podarcis muralis TaxID=64176 RepID=A0A670HMW0_PODMU
IYIPPSPAEAGGLSCWVFSGHRDEVWFQNVCHRNRNRLVTSEYKRRSRSKFANCYVPLPKTKKISQNMVVRTQRNQYGAWEPPLTAHLAQLSGILEAKAAVLMRGKVEAKPQPGGHLFSV